MKRSTTLFAAILASAISTGCGSGGGSSGSAATAAGIASSTSATPSSTTSATTPGSTPGGAGTGGTGTGGPDTGPPVITLTSPARGLFTTQTQVAVQGTVLDQTGVAYFIINGAAVLPGVGGAFNQPVTLVPGLNVIELEAADPLGKRTRTVVPVVAGQFLPESSVVTDAVAVRLNRPAFDAIERLAAQQLGGANLQQQILAQNPLATVSGLGANVRVDATQANFGTPVLDLDPQAGALAVRVELPSIDVRTRVSGNLPLGIPLGFNVAVTADRAIVTANAVVNVAAGGVVTTTLQNVSVSFVNFRYDVSFLPGFIETLTRDLVRGVVERQIRSQVERVVPAQINQAIAGANGPITQTVLGRPVTVRLIPTAVTFDVNGAAIRTNGDMVMTPFPGLPTTPGSLATTGAAPAHPTTPAFHVSINDDMLNRAGHAAWRGGLMNLTIDQARAQQLGLPAWFPLDAFLLQVFFPQLVGQINPLDPLEVEVSSATPVMFRTRPQGPALMDASVGDLTVAVYVAPAGQPRRLVLKAGTQVSVAAQPSVVNNTLRVAVVGAPTIKTDVFETPIVALDEVAVENFVDFILPPVIQLLPNAFNGFPLPVYPGLTPSGIQATTDGPQGDFVTVKGDL